MCTPHSPPVRRLILSLLLVAAGRVGAQSEPEADARPPAFLPDGPALLRNVIGAMPEAQMKVQGELRVKDKGGKQERLLHAEMVLDWNSAEPSARYTLRDAFGATLEALKVVRPPEGETEFFYYRGDPLAGGPLPNLYAPIRQTDISWIDLSLGFLWWPNGKTVGGEKIKGRFCYIVDVPSPAPGPDNYGGVRLWIDPQVYVLLQAVAYNAADEDIKRLQVKSFKKIKGVWMMSDLDIQDLITRHKTLLKVRNVELNDPPPSDTDEDAEPDEPDSSR